jgi:hypothetical protein
VLLKSSSCDLASISLHFLSQAIASDIGLGHGLPSLHTLFAPAVFSKLRRGFHCRPKQTTITLCGSAPTKVELSTCTATAVVPRDVVVPDTER